MRSFVLPSFHPNAPRSSSLRSARRVLTVAAALVPLAAPAMVRAQVTFNFTPAALNYTPSTSPQTLPAYTATISNLSSSVVYINDISINIDQASAGFATPNFTPFNNVPLTLSAFGTAGSSYSGQVFGINLAANANAAFSGNAQLIGGASSTEFNPITTLQQFAGFPTATTPEPGTLALMACGALGGARFGVTRLRRAKRVAKNA